VEKLLSEKVVIWCFFLIQVDRLNIFL
jgi:hypothetical protein